MKPSEGPTKPVPQQEARVPPITSPEKTVNLSEAGKSHTYWAEVQSKISRQWEPPPIDMARQTLTMIDKFRLQRDGSIRNVVVQQSSGNPYYDMAGQRAVERARFMSHSSVSRDEQMSLYARGLCALQWLHSSASRPWYPFL